MTTTRTVLLSPIDAWFFRDGRPYNEKESNQTDVVSLFPPPATTLVGALRAGLARANGWNGKGKWDANLNTVLGDGFEGDKALGKLSFQGPWLSRHGVLLFPMPLHVLGKSLETKRDEDPHWQPGALLAPNGKPALCDLGEAVRLPTVTARRDEKADSRDFKEPAGVWVTESGMAKVLRGNRPDQAEVFKDSQLWAHEARVGLKRDDTKRTTEKGALYSPQFLRLAPGVSLVMSVTGLPDGDGSNAWTIPELLPLGGENRLADCRTDNKFELPDFVSKLPSASKHITVTLLTPMLPPDSVDGKVLVPQANKAFFNWPGTTVISACVGKPQALGGWDSLKKEPLPLRPVLPAGSTWFLKADNPQALAADAARGIGLKTAYGFGQVALGIWPTSQGDSSQ